MFRQIKFAFLAAFLVGAIVVGIWTKTDTRFNRPSSESDSSSGSASREFLADWKRFRQGTWTIDSVFTRKMDNGRTFSGAIHDVQEPPRSLRKAFGTSTLDLPGRRIVCVDDIEVAKGTCKTTQVKSTFDEQVDNDIKAVKALISGVAPTYEVSSSQNNCYFLNLVVGQTAATWGESAQLCFDSSTGAISKSEIKLGNRTDITQAARMSSYVDPSEFNEPRLRN